MLVNFIIATKKIMISELRFNELFNDPFAEKLKIWGYLDSFEFDLEHDGKTYVIKLTNKVIDIGDYAPCTYFGYEFEDGIDENLKKLAIDHLRASDKIKNFGLLANLFINSLGRVNRFSKVCNEINLVEFKEILYPDTKTKLTDFIIDRASHYSLGSYCSSKDVKELPPNISFDYASYIKQLRKDNVNESDIEASCKTVRHMMTNIHNQSYFKNEQKPSSEFRASLKDYFKFNTNNQASAFEQIQYDHLLVIDDISTNHKNTKWLLNTIRNVNPTCELIVFCIGSDQDYRKIFLNS